MVPSLVVACCTSCCTVLLPHAAHNSAKLTALAQIEVHEGIVSHMGDMGKRMFGRYGSHSSYIAEPVPVAGRGDKYENMSKDVNVILCYTAMCK